MQVQATRATVTAIALWAAFAGAAAPVNAERIAVLELRLLQTPPALKQPVEQSLRRALRQAGYQIVDLPGGPQADSTDSTSLPAGDSQSRPAAGRAAQSALTTDSGDGAVVDASCVMGPCLSAVQRALDVARVVNCTVSAHGSSSYDVTLTMLETAGGTVLSQVDRRCDVCTYADAAAAVEKAALQLDVEARRVVAGQAWLTINSDPPGAAVLLDGKPLGAAPLTRLVGRGAHRLVVQAAGGQRVERQIRLRAGERRELLVRPASDPSLVPASAPIRSRASIDSWAWLGWSALAVGVAASVVGGILWSNHETLGAGLVGGGSAAAVSGISVLLLRDRASPDSIDPAHARSRSSDFGLRIIVSLPLD